MIILDPPLFFIFYVFWSREGKNMMALSQFTVISSYVFPTSSFSAHITAPYNQQGHLCPSLLSLLEKSLFHFLQNSKPPTLTYPPRPPLTQYKHLLLTLSKFWIREGSLSSFTESYMHKIWQYHFISNLHCWI